ncbi:hypothetical protein PHYSODRAFT_342559 [Phytophthora sojae]|uniref:NADH:flavin oxidoreductase/NADH oxidase N-terminal domain-containing protein n=1 Tax=Phytophthora sojae (strain P6497) TaxID=1094619 RepID=G5AGZ1_PHYSP|nr:hypothetical protein PHYSODRAFT_342559 [Phytophthora sojae]EGZ05184.1 hypothetical protein PHYSODRAFT_342559 [Phytophthora sojae]|eukprot:XP_009539342.1 hypothetical protein PHYSODRAFT_342559 [Phytophthora sojae]
MADRLSSTNAAKVSESNSLDMSTCKAAQQYTYYKQRATPGGLIIAEATNITPTDRGSWGSPDIFAPQQIEAWRHVTKAVHGKMFLQLSDNRSAAENALKAGFDGVELHAANGYLLEQFLHDGINDRADQYGGSVENRARFLFEALEAILESLDSSKVGIRLSPFGGSFGDKDSDPIATYTYVLNRLNNYDLAYARKGSARQFRETYKGVLLAASGFDRQSAVQIVEEGAADAVAIGRHFISNPDLVRRFQLNKPVNDYDTDTFYLGDARGYTDYNTRSCRTSR